MISSSRVHKKPPSPSSSSSSRSIFVAIFQLVACQLACLYRRMSKIVLHFLTKKCELERLCSGEKIESIRIKRIEKCLQSSKIPYLHSSIKYSFDARQETEEEIVVKIMAIKKIPRDENLNFLILMRDALMKINSYNRLINEVETFREKKFSFDNAQHAEILFKVWSNLKGADDKLESKITKRWTEIGFQGTDPGSDFRGMGLLGLINLFYFATHDVETARSVFSKSLHPSYGYPFAIVGINITSWIHKLLLDGHLKTHFYNDSELLDMSKINLENFHRIYGIIFTEFERFWFVNEPNIMHFERLTKKFNKLVTEKLSKDPHTIIQANFLGKTSSLKVNQMDLKSCF